MKDKIKKLIEILKEIDKLLIQLLGTLGWLTLVVVAIKWLIEQLVKLFN